MIQYFFNGVFLKTRIFPDYLYICISLCNDSSFSIVWKMYLWRKKQKKTPIWRKIRNIFSEYYIDYLYMKMSRKFLNILYNSFFVYNSQKAASLGAPFDLETTYTKNKNNYVCTTIFLSVWWVSNSNQSRKQQPQIMVRTVLKALLLQIRGI